MLAGVCVANPARLTFFKAGAGAGVGAATLDNVISAERQLYIAWSACPANSVPQTPGFVLRARLIQFDTENSVRGAKGFVFAALTQAKAQIS